MQIVLDHINELCRKWRLCVTSSKFKVVHFRNSHKSRSKYIFKIGDDVLEYTNSYKYLGVVFNEFSNFTQNA